MRAGSREDSGRVADGVRKTWRPPESHTQHNQQQRLTTALMPELMLGVVAKADITDMKHVSNYTASKIILISEYKMISGKKNAKVGVRVYVSVRAYVGVCVRLHKRVPK